MFIASCGYPRSPLLSAGLWYGLLGGTLASFLIRFSLIGPISTLSGSYDNGISPASPILKSRPH